MRHAPASIHLLLLTAFSVSSLLQAGVIAHVEGTMLTEPDYEGTAVSQSCKQTAYCDLWSYAYLASGDVTYPGANMELWASAGYGRVGLNSHSGADHYGFGASTFYSGLAEGRFTDRLGFQPRMGLGYLEVVATVNSNVCDTFIGCSFGDYQPQVHVGGQDFTASPSAPPDLHSFSFSTGLVSVNFTKPLDIGLFGQIAAYHPITGEWGSVFFEIILDSVRVYDSTGRPLSGFLYSSDSHALYDVEGGTYSPLAGAPEPSTLVLFGSALAIFAHLRRSRRY